MSPEVWGIFIAAVSLFVALATIIYNAGRQSARVDSLEKFRDETVLDLKIIRALTENISGAINARKQQGLL